MYIRTNKEDLQNYLEDTSCLRGAPSMVYLPSTHEELSAALRDCSSRKLPVTIVGGRTGTTGGCVAAAGAVISLERLHKIHSLDRDKKTITVDSGVTLEALEKEASICNLSFRAAPTEALAYIGGAIATGASGVRGFGYGSIRKYVRKLKVFLASGELLELSRGQLFAQKRLFHLSLPDKVVDLRVPGYSLPSVKTQAGYFVEDNLDLIDLFIGSEGTLGVIAAAEIQLQDMPSCVLDGLIFFPDNICALDFVSQLQILKESGKITGLISLEFFDKNSLAFLTREYSFIPKHSCAVYLEQEISQKNNALSCLEQWDRLIRQHNAYADKSVFADTAAERTRVYEFRHKLPQLINEFLRQKNQIKVASDCAVPRHQFRSMYDFYESIGKNSGIEYVNFGHIGESHLHFNFLPQSDAQQCCAREGLMSICRKAVELGGTVSAEHGIGKLKKPYLQLMYTQAQIEEMAKLKKYFDPNCMLNLDNIFDKELLLGIK